MAIEQADNIQTGAPKPTDSRYYNNLIPYSSCSEVNSTVGSGVRYSGLTVNILGTEYWYKDGIINTDLVEKTTGGELNWTGSTANGIGTYVDGTHICAEPNLTFDVNLGEPTLTISAATVNRALLNYCAGSSLIKLGFVDGTPDQFSLWDGADNVLFNVYPTTGTELFYNAAKKLETVTGGATITGIACATTCLKAPIIQLTTGAADGCVLTSNAAGCGVWATSSGGGGIDMSGSTANGITTYVDADTICAEPNLTFDGSTLQFEQGATRTISIAQATDGGAGDSLNICAGAGDDDTSPLAGGNLRLEGGTGSADTDTGNGGVGGYGILCGGVGGAGHASANGGCGGAAYVRGGAGGDGDTDGCGGHVYVCGGVSADNVAGDVYVCGGSGQIDGCVAIFHDTTKRLHTTITGIKITGGLEITDPATQSTETNILYIADDGTVASGATAGGTSYWSGDTNGISNSGFTNVGIGVVSNANYGLTLYNADRYGMSITNCLDASYNTSIACASGLLLNNEYNGLCDQQNFTNIYLSAHGTTGGGQNYSATMSAVHACCGNHEGFLAIQGRGPSVTCEMMRLCNTSTGVEVYTNGKQIVTSNIEFPSPAATSKFICGQASTTPSNLLVVASESTDADIGATLYLQGGANSSTGYGGNIFLCGGSGAAGTAYCGDVCIVGSCTYIRGCSNIILYAGSDAQIYTIANSCVSLRYDGVERLKTVSLGICLPNVSTCGCGIGYDWVSTSDCRLKKDIQPISSALSMVTQLCGVCYHFCDDEDKQDRIGLIAQDVEPILPEVVLHTEPDKGDEKYGITDGKLTIKYDKLTAVLIEAIKEQQTQINCLQKEINEIKNK